MIIVFSVTLNWLPAMGMQETSGGSSLWTLLRHMILPSIALSLIPMGVITRLVRASVLAFKQRDFVEAARAMGASDLRVLTVTILPNCLPPLTVQFTLTFATAVLTEAGLSFLGLGIRPPTPSWGMMLNTGRNVMALAPLYPVAAGAAVFVTVLSLNLIGDGLRDALDPHQFTRT